MHRDSVEKYLKGQIKAHERMVNVLNKVKEYESLKSFDQKVINKRINDCFRAFLLEVRPESRLNHLSFKYYAHKANTYTLEVYVTKPEGESYPYSITSECTVYNIYIVDGKRFDHGNFITAIDKKLADLEKDLEVLRNELEELDSIVAEYNNIQAKIKSFNDSYSYFIRQDFKFN